jgi:DNA polymerase I
MRNAMAEASRIVLGGFELNTDVSITRYPDRYMDKRGVETWEDIMRRLGVVSETRKRA